MLTLGIDTASGACDVSVVEHGVERSRIREEMRNGQDARLASLVEKLQSEARIQFVELDLVAVDVGPGSFTGIRVGVAFARAFALTLGIPCIGITSLMGSLPVDSSETTLVLHPAKRRPPDISFWAQGFKGVSPLFEPIEASIRNVESLMVDNEISSILSPVEKIQKYFPASPVKSTKSDATLIALHGERMETAGIRPSASPVYARAPDAVPAKPLAGL